MATLQKNKKKDGSIDYYSKIRYVFWDKPQYISLNANSLKIAELRHDEVNEKEYLIKKGQRYAWSWLKENGGHTTIKRYKVNEVIDRWLDIRKIEISNSHYKRNIISMNRFVDVVGANTPISNLTEDNIEQFKRTYKRVHTPSGININLRAIKTFLRWCHGENLIKKLIKVKLLKVPKSLPKYISEYEFDIIINLENIDNLYKNCFTLLYETGMRRSEVIEGELNGSFLIVDASISKTRIERQIKLTSEQIDLVQHIHLKRDEFLKNGFSLVTFKNRLTKEFEKACKKLNIYIKNRTNLHSLRHSFACREYLKTRDIYNVKLKLGHSSVTTTEVYARFNIDKLIEDFPTVGQVYKITQKLQENSQVYIEKCTSYNEEYTNSPLLN